MAQQTPPMTASTSDSVRSHAAAPAIPNNASVNNTGLIMGTNGLDRNKCLNQVISDPDSTNNQAELRPNHCRSDRTGGPLLPDDHSCKPIYDQQRDIRPEQANSRALSTRAMLHDTSANKRKHKNVAKDYSRAEGLLSLHVKTF